MKFSLTPLPRPPDAHALVGLDAAAVAFDHLDVDLHGVARFEVGYLFAGGKLRHLLFFELFDQIHWNFSVGCAG